MPLVKAAIVTPTHVARTITEIVIFLKNLGVV
jgi:hypothetical protein